MLFKRFEPSEKLKTYIKEYWIFENSDPGIHRQRIIPDGYCEIIFHYRTPYRINLHGEWESQTEMLFAGQISRHFLLENTGASGMIGLKLKPATPYQLFGLNMDQFKDKVVDLKLILGSIDNQMFQFSNPRTPLSERVKLAELWLLSVLKPDAGRKSKRVMDVVDIIFHQKGLIDIESLSKKVHVSKRHLEREFKEVVGLTPKFFCRIIRFNYIFEIMKAGDESWIDIALQSGHFDQSHFIKNFKEFTGEEPSQYGFNEKNMANFFLLR
jgi:AraC-like DNA-binding protein